jgi:hypothetical protein
MPWTVTNNQFQSCYLLNRFSVFVLTIGIESCRVVRVVCRNGLCHPARQGAGCPAQVVDLPTPIPRPGEILVKIGGAGASHSDLHVLKYGRRRASARSASELKALLDALLELEILTLREPDAYIFTMDVFRRWLISRRGSEQNSVAEVA